VLKAESVRQMTKDQLTPEQKAASSFFPGFFDSRGWGYGVAIYTAPDAVSRVPGRYGWDGGFGTSWLNDPGRDLVAIVMTNRPTSCSRAGSKRSGVAYTQRSSSRHVPRSPGHRLYCRDRPWA